MIDGDGYRPNVGIVVANRLGEVLWARRVGGQNAWQFPQGGMQEGEKPEQALFRELEEEIGLRQEHVKILGCTDGWLRYQLPQHMRRDQRRSANRSSRRNSGRSGGRGRGPVAFKGQKQKWFLLEMLANDEEVRFDRCSKPEFDGFQWVSYWYPINQVIEFKREVYRRALKQLAPRLPVDQEQLQLQTSGSGFAAARSTTPETPNTPTFTVPAERPAAPALETTPPADRGGS